MLVAELLLETLEELRQDDFEKLKWYLSMNASAGYKPIPPSQLETASRLVTVSKIIESNGEEKAVNVTAEILKRMNNNDAAKRLMNKYAGAVNL